MLPSNGLVSGVLASALPLLPPLLLPPLLLPPLLLPPLLLPPLLLVLPPPGTGSPGPPAQATKPATEVTSAVPKAIRAARPRRMRGSRCVAASAVGPARSTPQKGHAVSSTRTCR